LKAGVGLGVLVGGAAIWWSARLQPTQLPPAVVTPPIAQHSAEPPVVASAPAVAPPLSSATLAPAASSAVASARVAPPPSHSTNAPPLAASSADGVTGAGSSDGSPDEATLFRRAGAALRGGDPNSTLQLVDEQARRFPHGTFAQEREVLKIDALVALGRSGEARDRARAFLAQHPESAHRPRLERMLAQ
jgi:hypothetical protein